MSKCKFVNAITFSLLLVAGMTLVPGRAVAQLITTPGTTLSTQGWNADSLVRNVMVGQGVEVFNVEFNGSSSINCTGVGTFSTGSTSTNLGLTSGIVLSASAMDYLTSTGGSSTNSCTNANDADLAAVVSPKALNNCVTLEFDFIPLSDSIRFRYVFASEEYYGFECSSFNDVFAFFISGVNPVQGGYYTNKNIALVPGTSIPITISTVNSGTAYGSDASVLCDLTNSQYFVSNSSMTYLKHMDGFTTVLTAEAKVVPCFTYHLKMAIANVSDQSLPSAVFLEANSLSSNPIEFEFINAANPNVPADLYEGCSATVKMSRDHPSNTDVRIDVVFEGEATNGVDFEMWNPSFYFPDTALVFYKLLSPYQDGLSEGNGTGSEMCKIVLSAENGCPRSDSTTFNILDTDPITVHIERDTLTSSTFNVQLHAVVSGGMPEKKIMWTNLVSGQVAYGETITIGTTPDSRWLCEAIDSCFNYGSDTMTIGIRRNFAALPADTIICDQETLRLFSRYLKIYGDTVGIDSCVWYTSQSTTPFEMHADTVYVTPHEVTTYYVRSYLYWNGQYWEDLDSMNVTVVPLPYVDVVPSANRICKGQSVLLTATGTNQYSWDGGETFEYANNHTYIPDSTTLFIIYGVTAGADCYGRDSILITVDTVPDIVISGNEGVCGGEDVELTVETTAESFTWSASPADATLGGQETRTHVLINPLETTLYTVDAVNGVCSNSASWTVHVETPPVAIGEVSPLTVSLGSMEATFTDKSEFTTSRVWLFEDGETHTDQSFTYLVPDDVDSVNVLLTAYNPYMCWDTTTVTVYVDHTTLWMPNAFTPEESTNNTFLVKLNDIQRYHIYIYDRRGQLVFESYDPEKPWDGTFRNGEKCPQGVYTYFISGHKITHPYEQLTYRGTVVLIR